MEIIWNLDRTYSDFVSKYGVQPTGLLMNEATYLYLRNMMNTPYERAANEAVITYNGMTIYRSQQIEINQIKFVI